MVVLTVFSFERILLDIIPIKEYNNIQGGY